MRILRSVLAVVAGLVLITLIVEPIEFALVALANGGVTTDQDVYFAVRNQPAFLAAKLVYNSLAAIAGGYAAAWLAGRAPMAHGIVLALVQTVAFGWALSQPTVRPTTPDWVWACLIALSFAGILAGSALRRRRAASARTVPQRRHSAPMV